MATPSNRRVIVVGAGIAGPILAILLKRKGWDVVLYEKLSKLGDVHGGVYLQSNGVKVLSLLGILPELLQPDKSAVLSHLEHTSWSSDPPFLISCPLAADVAEDAGGYPFLGIRRSLLQHRLHDLATELGIPFHFGKAAVKVEQNDTSATVTFADGTSDAASFMIAGDGIHSTIRKLLFGAEEVSYTGLCQAAGIAPTPPTFSKCYAFRNFYAPGAHIVFYNVSNTHSLFAATLPEDVALRENWGKMSDDDMRKWKAETPFAKWGGGVADCILAADRVVKYGMYDRPPLKTWHQGRILLIGDAAHPTSPHLGQGGNQAMEDVYHLIRLLPSPPETATSPPLSTATLDAVWTEYEDMRIARTSAFVQAARKMGEDRTESDPVKISQRDAKLRALYDDKDAAVRSWQHVARHPFWKESEIVF